MSVLAGLISRSGVDVTPRLTEMLRVATRARSDSYGFASPDAVEHGVGAIGTPGFTSGVALGFRLLRAEPGDNPQPLRQGRQALAFDGRLWGTHSPDAIITSDLVRGDAEEGLRYLLTEQSGSWVASVAEEGRLLCCRDPIGVIPLYYGLGGDLLGVASNAKTLRAVGLTPKRVEPGHIMTLTRNGCSDEKVVALENPQQVALPIDEAVERLDALLTVAARRSCSGVDSPTLAFSGGIDSVLLAHYMGNVGAKPRLSCVGVEGSSDLEAAEVAAEALNMPVGITTYDEGDVEESLDAILLSVEEADPMKVGVAVPLHRVARGASGRRCRVMVSGDGSDELFGGYSKYVVEYQSRGDSVRETMFGDVFRSHGVNFERDWKICSDLDLELRLPFADPDLTTFALSLPLEYKLPKSGKEPRKMILRRLASKLGLPDGVANRPKKAAQYSSGAAKILERLAKRSGKTVEGYLSDRMRGIRREAEQD